MRDRFIIWLKRISAAALIVIAAAVVVVLLAVALFSRQDRIAHGVTMADVYLGGMSAGEAQRSIEAWWKEKSREQVVLTALDVRESMTPSEMGAAIDVRKALKQAMRFGRSGSILARIQDVLVKDGAHKKVVPPISVDSSVLHVRLKKTATRVGRPAGNARLRIADGRLSVVPEHYGIRINEERSSQAIARALAYGRKVIPLIVEEDVPEVRAEDARNIDFLLATFKTPFNPAKRDRTYNLRLAASAVNGVILKPGMEFSYNQIVGPRVMSRGFRNAPIFVRGKLEPGIGGGICQVSSTIYNAVLLAGLKVTERSHHSRIVPYVGPGRDATVNYGLLDLKFVNTNSKPIALITELSGSWLRVDVYGSREDLREVYVTAGDIKYKPAGIKTITDRTLEPGTREVTDHGAPGVSVTIYRKIVDSRGGQKTEVVSRDYYPPQPKVVSVGPVRQVSTRLSKPGPAANGHTSARGTPDLGESREEKVSSEL